MTASNRSVKAPRRLAPMLLGLMLGILALPALAEVDEDGFKNPLSTIDFRDPLPPPAGKEADLSLEFLEVYDPLAPLNKRIYKFNQLFDEFVFLPVVKAYVVITPDFLRQGVSNFFANVAEVLNVVNNALQLQGEDTLVSVGRLGINTTIGLLGVFDVATVLELDKRPEDFGQTLGYYGVGNGPYLMLPILGPSNLRDAGGRLVDYVVQREINFLGVPQAPLPVFALWAINQRYTTPFLYGEFNSPVEYGALRYLYTRARRLLIDFEPERGEVTFEDL